MILFLLGCAVLFVFYVLKYGDHTNQYSGVDGGVFNFEETNPDLTPFAVVMDVETTGLIHAEGAPTRSKLQEWDEGYPRIVQIAWITITRNYEAVHKRSFFIKQSEPIPHEAVAIHGITDERVHEMGVELKDVLIQFRQDVEFCEYFVGHNVKFDKYVIEAECLRSGLAKPFVKKGKYDTMVMGRSVMKRKFFKLQELAKQTMPQSQFENIEFHDAEQDVYVTAALFSALHKAGIKY